MLQTTVKEPFLIQYIKKDDYLRQKFKKEQNYYEISYLVTGERKYVISDSLYQITPGTLVLTHQNTSGRTLIHDGNYYERIVIRFSKDDLCDLSHFLHPDLVCNCFKDNIKILKLDYNRRNVFEGYLYELLKDYETGTVYTRAKSKLLLCQILILLSEYISETHEEELHGLGEINPKVSEIIMYINKHYEEDLTLNELSQRFYISPFYLAKLFKNATNSTIVHYINALRVKKAKELLVGSDQKIIDIAYAVGYNSHTHFTRVFTQYCEETPNQFRKRHS